MASTERGSVPSKVGYGAPIPSQLGGLGESRELSSGVRGRNSGRKFGVPSRKFKDVLPSDCLVVVI